LIRQAGFTMVELITVMVLLGVLAAFAVPRIVDGDTTGPVVYGEQVVSALRLAQKTAVARRRTVCATTAPGAVTLRIKTSVGNGACNAGMDEITDDLYTSRDPKIVLAGAPGELRFQPDGTILDNQGARFGALALRIESSGKLRRTIDLDGGTGYVD